MSFENEIRRNNRRNKKFNKTIMIGYAAVAIVCIVIVAILGAFGNDNDNHVASSSMTSNEISSVSVSLETSSEISSVESISSVAQSSKPTSSKATSSKAAVSSKITSTASKETSSKVTEAYVPNGDWRLIIANKQHPMPESYKVSVSYLDGGYRIDSRVKDTYNAMIAAAKKDGISLKIISGFRTFSGQETLFNNKVNYYLNQGYSREKAKELAAQYVAPPGTSEHLTGLAVDLISPDWYNTHSSLTADFENTKQFKWLYEHCAEYGFILRYPKDKVSITGYSYEPWHYRYVGVEAAKEIMGKKICLEEYVAGL